jgi:glucokinase
MYQHIAVDIGGTQLRAASYLPDSTQPVKIKRIHTQDPRSSPLERLQMLISEVWPEEDRVAGIAVAAPGPTDPYRGVVLEAPNIPGWDGLPLKTHLENHFKVPVAIGNDANLAALGEWKFGAGRGHHHLIYLTISTGIGGGVITDDRLLLGGHGLAAELGHVTVMPDGPMCGCGVKGHLESFASGTAIARFTEAEIARGVPSSLPAGQTLTARLVAEAARSGDLLATSVIMRAGTFLGIAIANYLHIFNPTLVILGGGVTLSGNLLLDPLRTSLQNHVMNPGYLDDLKIELAVLGDNVGLMGALALAHTQFPD